MLFSTLIALFSLAGVALSTPIPQVASLEKRQSFNGRATFYDVGLGACGQYNVESDFIVALNTPQYGGGYPGPNCGRTITISYGGKTAQATIMDQCPSCGFGDLDLSRSLFNHFSDPGAGVFQMSWHFNGGGNSDPEPEPAPAPEPTTTHRPRPTPTPTPTPTSTWTPPSSTRAPRSTSTWSPEPVIESTESTSSSTTVVTTSSTSSSASDFTPSASASIEPYVVPLNATVSGSVISIPLPSYALPMGNLALLNQMVTNLGAIVVIGAQMD